MKFSLIFSLLIASSSMALASVNLPDVSAAEAQARQDFANYPPLDKARETVAQLAEQMQGIMGDWSQRGDAFIAPLPELTAQPLPPEPKPSNDTIVDSTKGLYFDAQQSMMSYFGQVRMRDPRLSLDCERLFIQLEKRRVKQESSEFEAEVEKTETRDFTPSEHAQTETVIAKEQVPEPMIMSAKQVLVDMQLKRLYATGDVVELKHSRGDIRAEGGEPIMLIDDKAGLIYVKGHHISGFSVDEKGEKNEFSSEGYVLFELDSDSILLARQNKIQTPKGDIACRGLLRVRMQPAEEQKPSSSKGFRLNRAYDGLSYVTALDDVVVSGTQADGTPFRMSGDLLSYDARIGEMIMTGEQCHLSSAEQNMQVQGDATARLYADGSMKLKGGDIFGSYQRPSRSGEGLLHGTYQTQGEILMTAADGQLRCPHGLVAKDEELDFACTREVVVSFEREPATEEAKPQQSVAVMPDFAFSRIKGIAHVAAAGDIQAKGMGEWDFYAQGDELEADLIEGTALVRAKAAQWAQFTYQGAQLKARSQDRGSEVQLLANGDIKMAGDVIEGYMPAREDKSSFAFETQNDLYLNNAESLLVMPHPVHMESDQGIFNSQGGLTASLRRAEKPASTGRGFARHDFGFTGVEWAQSPRDSSLQSPQLSLQCDGFMRLVMEEEGASQGQDATLAGLQSAEAHDAVRFIAKDAQGKLYRATGEHLSIDGHRGTKLLTGPRVTLSSGHKLHEASGAGAQVFVDAKNNVRLSGAQQTTVVTDVREEFGREAQQEQKKNKP
ncbi:MAG: hypothetical protein R3Y56_01505 [Akkermansia sp.]